MACAGMAHIGMAYIVAVPRREDLDLVGLAEVELGPSALLRLVLRQQRQAVASRRALDVPALQDIGMALIVMALCSYGSI